MSEILIKPVVTEKMNALGEKLGRYGFIVDKNSNKIQIKKAVEGMYGVTVKEVKTMVMPGKKKVTNTKKGAGVGFRSSFKKAIVTLNPGETIDFYSNI